MAKKAAKKVASKRSSKGSGNRQTILEMISSRVADNVLDLLSSQEFKDWHEGDFKKFLKGKMTRMEVYFSLIELLETENLLTSR